MAERDAKSVHNANAGRLVGEMWRLAGENIAELNVFAESLLLGVAMLNFPNDPRRQALIIQEISDAAQDRATAVGERKRLGDAG